MTDRKVKLQNEIDQLSPEELEKEIENNKRKVARSIIFIAAAAIAFIAICIAWFVSNNRVSGTSGTVSAKYSGIEIGSEGKAGVHDDLLKTIKDGITSYFPEKKEEHDTSQGGSINWMLSENSNMNNYKDGESFEETGAVYRKDYAMEPGTKGQLDFFIKTYEAGNLSLDFSLDISPFHIGPDNNPVTVGNNTAEAGLLSGHILYFLGEKQSDENTIKYTWIKDGKFQIKIQNAKKDTKYNYSIYWVWPLNLSTILLNNGDEFLNESDVEFDDKDSTGKLRNTIVTDMTKHPEKYFFSSLTGQPLNTNYAEVKEISKIHENSGKKDGIYDKQLFVDLSSYYNQADMKIGAGISFVTATLRYLGTTNKTTEAQNER
ncbi:Uncharacterised protein [uncultured Blautia sp.]|nr:hypothetical protein [uncultured Blautia sp.]SCH27376.1 Uncharacterised protein [uncultured Blautia sp.]